jgi:hypothetical protein
MEDTGKGGVMGRMFNRPADDGGASKEAPKVEHPNGGNKVTLSHAKRSDGTAVKVIAWVNGDDIEEEVVRAAIRALEVNKRHDEAEALRYAHLTGK